MIARLVGLVVGAVLLAACASGSAGTASMSPTGPALMAQHNCVSCHTIDGSRSVGPTWRGLAGREVTLTDGSVVVADETYLRESMLDPQAAVVDGFTTVAMPTLDLDPEEVDVLVDFIESLEAGPRMSG